MAEKRLYSILGVPEDADAKTINRAYRKLAKKYHPDINKDPGAADIFKDINLANEVLTDEKKRQLYDAYGEDAIEANFNEEVLAHARNPWNSTGGFGGFQDFGGFSQGQGFSGFDGFTRGGSSFFEDLFGGGFQGGFDYPYNNPSPKKGQDYQADITIDFMKSVKGGNETVSFMVDDGTGQPRNVTYDVKIPAGIRPGQKIRLAKKGAPGVNGGEEGDLLLTVNVRDDATFKRDGNDINVVVSVDFTTAILGGSVEVPTLDGKVNLKIPAGTQPNQKFRLKGKGVVTSKATGDEYAQIKVILPKTLTDRQKELIEEFQKTQQED